MHRGIGMGKYCRCELAEEEPRCRSRDPIRLGPCGKRTTAAKFIDQPAEPVAPNTFQPARRTTLGTLASKGANPCGLASQTPVVLRC